MRSFLVFAVSMMLVAIHFSVSGQDSGIKPNSKPAAQPAAETATPKTPATKDEVPKNPASNDAGKPDAPSSPSPDEKAIRQTAETYVKAFNQQNAKAVAEHFTPEAEYIDEFGRLYHGRSSIEKSLTGLFEESPGAQVELRIDTIRLIGSGVAVEDGMTRITRSKDTEPVMTRYTAVHTKTAGKWLVASVRDSSVKSPRQHRNQLKQLDWMLGDWVHEGSDAVVMFSCKPVDNGNFLLRTFKIKIGGEEVLSGSQRIGWDASSHKFRAWTFDSDGGHSEGSWYRDGDSWVLKSAGITADGHTASNSTIYTSVNAHTMTFQSINHEVSGVELPDGPKVTIVRHAPQPD